MSKAIIIKGIDASSSPLGQITFVAQEVDLTSQIKWMGLIGGQSKMRFFKTKSNSVVDTLVPYETNVPMQTLGGSIGFIDVTEFQGATLELCSHPWNVGDNRYFNICFADALSDDGVIPIVDEGIEVIPMTAAEHSNAIHTISVYSDSVNSKDTLRTVQFTVPTVNSGKVYFCFIENSAETTFGGYVKILAG